MPKPDELTTAAALRAKATKALDTMRARIVKADEARTEAAHQTRAAPVTLTPRPAGPVGCRFPRASAPPPGERAPTRARTLRVGPCHVRCPCAPVLPAALPRGPLCRGRSSPSANSQ